MPALGDDDVGPALAGLDKLLVHGLDRAQILVDDALEAAAAVAHVAHDAAQDAHIRVGVDVELDVHLVAELAVFVDQDALDHDDPRRPDGDGLVRAVVDRVVIDRAGDGLALLEVLERLHQQVGVEGVGMVVVELGALLIGHVVVRLVVVVVVDDGYLAAEILDQPPGDGGLAAAGAAGNADDHDIAVAHLCLLPLFFVSLLFYHSRRAVSI